MIPKLVYKLNGVEKTIVFDVDEITAFQPNWKREEIEYKNPFTGRKDWKKRGYYFTAIIAFEGLDYNTLEGYRDIVNINATDLQFFPNQDGPESYEVDTNEEFAYEDDHSAQAVKDFELLFRGNVRYETPLSYGYDLWGDRRHTFADEADELF